MRVKYYHSLTAIFLSQGFAVFLIFHCRNFEDTTQ